MRAGVVSLPGWRQVLEPLRRVHLVDEHVAASRGCDVLIHEVYSATAFEQLPPDWRRYHSSMHTSMRELAQIASRARPGLLILYHGLFWGQTEEELLWEIRSGYDGEVVLGKDLEVY